MHLRSPIAPFFRFSRPHDSRRFISLLPASCSPVVRFRKSRIATLAPSRVQITLPCSLRRRNQTPEPALLAGPRWFPPSALSSHSSFSPLEIARSLLFSIDFVCFKGEERRSASHLGLGEGRDVARAEGIVCAQDALETQGDHALRKEEEKEGIERRGKEHSVESFFLFEFCAARRLFFSSAIFYSFFQWLAPPHQKRRGPRVQKDLRRRRRQIAPVAP